MGNKLSRSRKKSKKKGGAGDLNGQPAAGNAAGSSHGDAAASAANDVAGGNGATTATTSSSATRSTTRRGKGRKGKRASKSVAAAASGATTTAVGEPPSSVTSVAAANRQRHRRCCEVCGADDQSDESAKASDVPSAPLVVLKCKHCQCLQCCVKYAPTTGGGGGGSSSSGGTANGGDAAKQPVKVVCAVCLKSSRVTGRRARQLTPLLAAEGRRRANLARANQMDKRADAFDLPGPAELRNDAALRSSSPRGVRPGLMPGRMAAAASGSGGSGGAAAGAKKKAALLKATAATPPGNTTTTATAAAAAVNNNTTNQSGANSGPPIPDSFQAGKTGVWKLTKRLGRGGFGEVWAAVNEVTGEPAAAKTERRDNDRVSHLDREWRVFCVLERQRNKMEAAGGDVSQWPFPRALWYGKTAGCEVLLLERKGPSLQKVFRLQCGGLNAAKRLAWGPATVCALALPLLRALRVLHEAGLVYRDWKPGNVVTGNFPPSSFGSGGGAIRKQGAAAAAAADGGPVVPAADQPDPNSSSTSPVFLIDFGLTTAYRNPKTGALVPEGNPRTGSTSMTGTAQFASVAAHEHRKQSPRDDLEAMGYVLCYFLRGSLPWHVKTTPDMEKSERFRMIFEGKRRAPPKRLCDTLPRGARAVMRALFRHVGTLKYGEMPDYEWLERTFIQAIRQQGYANPQRLGLLAARAKGPTVAVTPTGPIPRNYRRESEKEQELSSSSESNNSSSLANSSLTKTSSSSLARESTSSADRIDNESDEDEQDIEMDVMVNPVDVMVNPSDHKKKMVNEKKKKHNKKKK